MIRSTGSVHRKDKQFARVAIVHDYIKEYGGAERVLETLVEIYPDADIYTVFYSPSFLGPHRKRFEKLKTHTTWFQHVPFKNKLLSYFRLIAPLVFKKIDLSAYDLIITSATGTYTSPNFVKKSPKAKLICYCHTPPRYLYGYSTAAPWNKIWWRKLIYIMGQIPIHFIRLADFSSSQKPDYFIANSKEVAQRIQKYYRRDSTIIYPPVEIRKISLNESKKDYYLTGGRLARPKHTELSVLACSRLGLTLKVFGREFSGYGKELHKIAGPTVEFLGEVNDDKKWELYRNAKAFLFPADNEDFGIMPVEAMASGIPVIAHRSGGATETVIENKTGILFDELTVDSLTLAIRTFEKMKFNSNDITEQAQKFNKERFIKEFKEFVAFASKS